MNTNQAIEILAFNKKPLKKKFKTVKAYMAAYHKYRNAQLALGLPTCTLYTRRNKVGVNSRVRVGELGEPYSAQRCSDTPCSDLPQKVLHE